MEVNPMSQLLDEISDAQKPLSFISLNFSTHGSSETEHVSVIND